MDRDANADFYQEVQSLVLELIQTPSIVKTAGQLHVAQKVHNYLARVPYFQRFPQHLRLLPVDEVSGANVMALVKGSQSLAKDHKSGAKDSQSPDYRPGRVDTVILIGHLDTVGVEDYGALKEHAFQPFQLSQRLWEINLNLPAALGDQFEPPGGGGPPVRQISLRPRDPGYEGGGGRSDRGYQAVGRDGGPIRRKCGFGLDSR
ncbi:MAG: hypothetical protein M1379_14885 [Firmicutes bacterium]|nr:hypothetical protein [Bacillota bacterium]